VRGALLSAASIGAFGVLAAPATAADVTIRNFAFSPTPVTIAQGDTVTWHWAGPDTNHSVTSDPNQADSFDSDPLKNPTPADHPPGDTFDHTFNTAGSFTYFCKVHTGMHGKVVVTAPGGGPPPDTTVPGITGLKATGGLKCKPRTKKCRGRPTTVRFNLSEDAQVKIEAAGRTRATLAGHTGANAAKLSTKKLPPGKYTLKLTATDAAGNASKPAQTKVTVKRR
jgi:plastocyanin